MMTRDALACILLFACGDDPDILRFEVDGLPSEALPDVCKLKTLALTREGLAWTTTEIVCSPSRSS